VTNPEGNNKHTAALIAALAVLLTLLHLGMIAAQREGLQAAMAASDAFVAAERLKASESVVIAQANMPGLDRDVRADALAQASRLRQGERPENSIAALESRHQALRAQSQSAATRASGLALGEMALLLAILLLAVGEMIDSTALRRGAYVLGLGGVVAGLLAVLGMGWA